MTYVLYVGACFINAFICCGLIQLLMRKVVTSDWRYLITYILYIALAFVMTSPGEGLLNVNFAEVDLLRFFLYISGGACVCLLFYLVKRFSRRNERNTSTQK